MFMWEPSKNRVIEWAKLRSDLRMGLIVGSQARRVYPADDYADLDLILYTADPQQYRPCEGWINDIGLGDIWTCVEFPRSDGSVEYQALLEGGPIVDFSFESLDRLRSMVEAQQLSVVCVRGYTVLFDKEGWAERLPPVPFSQTPVPPPSESAFRQVVDRFWLKALKTARAIKREHLWFAKMRDRELKDNLLTMLEWHARALNSPDHDTWVEGRFLHQWADQKTQHELQAVFGEWRAESSWSALWATLKVFRRLAREVAAHYQFEYSDRLDQNVTQLIESLTQRGSDP